MFIIITKHIYKNKIKQIITQHRICEIHVSRYIFFLNVRSALDAWKRKHIYKNKIKQAINKT